MRLSDAEESKIGRQVFTNSQFVLAECRWC